MSRADVEEFVWRNLSARRIVVGRAIADRLTRRAIRAWHHDVPRLPLIGSQVEAEARAEIEMGFLASLLLSAIVSEIVQALWHWFNQSNGNRCLLYGFQREMATDEL